MFASLLRHSKGRPRSERTPLLAALNRYRTRTDADEHSASEDDDEPAHNIAQYEDEDGDDEDDQSHHGVRDGPLLPVFSEFLDRVPIYGTTHSIRILVIQKCETTLSWDQLRSPQISQFLVKPLQQQILSDHFSRGTLYCLLANCLQFRKEGEANPGNIGVSKTRALICELLAMRLLKEFSTRELIDALSYDFDPLQGMAPLASGLKSSPRNARISALEVAIRAQAKKFLAHPLVVQQLEAIWAGTIVFHSTADSLHRQPSRKSSNYRHGYSTFDDNVSPGRGPSRIPEIVKQEPSPQASEYPIVRRQVTLYDPHDASLFKLSRLRVPRYRNIFSTISFAIMLGLFIAVLAERSTDITALEVLFWFWSAGYMLDEIVGFSEQGFGLYIMSVWNAFDLGILLLFIVYYVLRLYGILMPDVQRTYVAHMAYDVLGASAVLLFPRLFSALDHYKYFSQLLIAFRMMAMDLVAILVLIVISCSGFLVAFTLAFKKDLDVPSGAYALFQMLMGFTPAAWEIWEEYNPLGKTLLTLFLFICHFLIVTILITVLTNSFMAIVQNANEEHQFLFAVNTISMVKSDALFSYIAPTNIIGWLVIPMKFLMPFRKFIRMNRMIIKITHMPILFSIFLYERLLLSNFAYGPTDLVEQRGRAPSKTPAFTMHNPTDVFSPGHRLREPSIATFHKDRALEEVFRRPFRDSTVAANNETYGPRRNSSNVVRDWMKGVGNDGGASPPQEEARSLLDRLETRQRPRFRRTQTAQEVTKRRKHPLAIARSVASDPDPDNARSLDQSLANVEEEDPDMSMTDIHQRAEADVEADGDDELVTNDADENDEDENDEEESDVGRASKRNLDSDKENRQQTGYDTSEDEYFRTPMAVKPRTPVMSGSLASSVREGDKTPIQRPPTSQRPQTRSKPAHNRNMSTNTILFSPSKESTGNTSRSTSPARPPLRSGTTTPGRIADGRRTPKRNVPSGARPRAIMPPRDGNRPTSNIASFLALNQRRDPSFNAMALDLASDLGDNNHNPNFGPLGAVPASFTTQFELATRARPGGRRGSNDDSNRMSRIMLARMTTLEEGFRDVLKEVKGLKKGSEDGVMSKEGSKGNSVVGEQLGKKKGKNKKKGSRKDESLERFGSSV